MRWRLKSSASRLFTQPFVQIKENIKAPRHWPLCGEVTGEFSHKGPVTRKMFPIDDVIIQADDQVCAAIGSLVASERNILEKVVNTTAVDTKISLHTMSNDGTMHYRYLVVISFQNNKKYWYYKKNCLLICMGTIPFTCVLSIWSNDTFYLDISSIQCST